MRQQCRGCGGRHSKRSSISVRFRWQAASSPAARPSRPKSVSAAGTRMPACALVQILDSDRPSGAVPRLCILVEHRGPLGAAFEAYAEWLVQRFPSRWSSSAATMESCSRRSRHAA